MPETKTTDQAVGKAYSWLIDHELIDQTASWSAAQFQEVFQLTDAQAEWLHDAVADYHDPINNAVDLSKCSAASLQEAVAESIHGGLEGFSPDERVAIVRFLTDLKRYIHHSEN